jgi:hypothetical protein
MTWRYHPYHRRTVAMTQMPRTVTTEARLMSTVVTGLALRSTRTLDPVLAESPVWRVKIFPAGGAA